jgi:cytochrome c-type biogenesis protein CcmH
LCSLACALACAVTLVQAQTVAPPTGTAPATRQAQPMSADPVLEARVLKVAEELRCLVCQNETIAASHAELAVDLRKQIRLKLGQGQSERQILDFMVERYGEFVLYRPRLSATTVLLWAGPFVLLLTAAGVLGFNIRKRRQGLASDALSPAQAQRARELLEEGARTPQPRP